MRETTKPTLNRRVRWLALGLLCLALAAQASSLRLTQAIESYWRGDYETAEALLRRIEVDELDPPEQSRFYQFFGLTLIARGHEEEAKQRFADLLELQPDFKLTDDRFSPQVLDVFERAKELLAGRLYDRAVELYSEKDFAGAVELLGQAHGLNPTDPTIDDLLQLSKDQASRLQAATPVEPPPPPPPPCTPSRVWGTIETRRVSCQGIELRRLYKDDDTANPPPLPAPANHLTLIYANHNFGVGECFKLVLYDDQGQVIHTFEDPQNTFAGKDEPSSESRWQEVDLPEVHTIAGAVLFAEDRYDAVRVLASGLRKAELDQFVLALEVVCPPGTKPAPAARP